MVQTSVQSSSLAIDSLQIHPHRTWEQFKLLQKGLEHSAGIRLFFFQGTIEVLMPGSYHELFKKIIALLIETFLIDRQVEFLPTGSMDRESEGMAAAQPDESYEIGDFKLVIEVIVSSGSISKLELYQTLNIDEVWFWKDGVLSLYHLNQGEYQRVDRSGIPALASLDIPVLTRCILLGETSRLRAIEQLRVSHAM
ncbi:MAG: Uma2 family endonuclease [Synechococcales bacterium]|nr:Uma2 family endonuclease [Synechococcales bacterium]